MTDLRGNRWKELCEAIMREHDPNRLLELVQRLNETLDAREAELKRSQEK